MTEGDDLETAAALSGTDNSPVRRVVLFLSLKLYERESIYTHRNVFHQ